MKGPYLSILSAGMLLGLAGCASTGGEPPQTGEQLADVPAAAADTTYTLTGSRIRHRKDADDERPELNSAFPVTVYGRDDLARTGERDLSKALMLLHPPLNR